MNRLIVTLFVLVFVPVVAHPAPVPPEAKADAKAELGRLTGTWEIVSTVRGGKKQIDFPDVKTRITFKADGSYQWGSAAASGYRVARIDPTKKPKEIDYQSGDDEQAMTQKAIYKLEGDTFIDCFTSWGAKDRPTEFNSTKENGYTLVTYKRVKVID